MSLILNEKQINVLSQTGAHGVTDKYQKVSTMDLINDSMKSGFEVQSVSIAKVRNASKQGYQKHIVRLSHPDLVLKQVGDSRPEIVIVNSHDGLSSLKVLLGIYRMVCSNGLIAGTTFGGVTLRHIGDNMLADVYAAVERIKNALPLVSDEIAHLNSVELSTDQQLEMARQSLELIELPDNVSSIRIMDLLRARRSDDVGSSAWLTYNRIEETLVSGGLRYQTETKDEFGVVSVRNNTLRAIKSIDRRVSVERGLWDIAKSIAA